ncbi:Uncharacterised protein [Klebsiella pneumoniae]|nr:Uncharacterised protein [Klebsiella pneumoniae]
MAMLQTADRRKYLSNQTYQSARPARYASIPQYPLARSLAPRLA